jgi:hypothetical protein
VSVVVKESHVYNRGEPGHRQHRGEGLHLTVDQILDSAWKSSTHIEHILAKLGFSSRTQIAAWVAERKDPRGAERIAR